MSATTLSSMLKPCPFCGGELAVKGARSAAYIECRNQDTCGMTTNLVADVPKMMEWANTRATIPA